MPRESSLSLLTTGFWRTLSPRALLKLLAAVFFTFSTVGIVGSLTSPSTVSVSVPLVVASWLFTGLMSAAWVAAFMTDRRLLIIVIPVQVTGLWLLEHLGGNQEWLERSGRLAHVSPVWLNGASIACLIVGYLFFIHFILTEGVAHLRLRTEVTLAEQTHRRLVPPVALTTDRIEAVGRSLASTEVGGDLVDLVELPQRHFLYIVDVCGHGIAAGTLMSLTKGAIRARLLSGATPREILPDVNRVLLDLSGPASYATFAGVSLNGEGSAEILLAGHLPILRRSSQTHRVEQWENENLPLGILESADYDARIVEVEQGDVLALLTDGLTEVVDRADRELGIEGVSRILEAHGDEPLVALHERILAAARAHGPQLDDQTLLLIRVLP